MDIDNFNYDKITFTGRMPEGGDSEIAAAEDTRDYDLENKYSEVETSIPLKDCRPNLDEALAGLENALNRVEQEVYDLFEKLHEAKITIRIIKKTYML